MRSQVLQLLDTGEPATLEFVTADRKRGTGGKWMVLENWVKAGADNKKGTVLMKNPGAKHAHPVPVHIALIQTFNGKKLVNG